MTDASSGRGHLRARSAVWLAYCRRHHFVILLLGATLFTRAFWALAVPAFQNPDEPQHLSYVQSLGEDFRIKPNYWISREIGVVEDLTGLVAVPFHPAETQGFAADTMNGPRERELDGVPSSLRTTDQVGRANSAEPYPPTYYLLASVVYRLLAGFNVMTIVFGIRLLSAAISTGTMFFNYLTLKRFFAEDERTAKASALMIAIFPMYSNMGAAINVDVLVWLVFSIFLYLITVAFDKGLSHRLNLGIGVCIAAGMIVKQTFLIAFPMYAILLGFLWYKRSLALTQLIISMGTVLTMLVVLDGWLYASGIIGTSPSYPGEHERQARSLSGFVRHLYDRWWNYSNTFDTLWGTFGWLDTPLSKRIFGLIRTGSAIATVGLAFHIGMSAVNRRLDLKTLFYTLISVAYVFGWIVINYLRITTGEAWLLQGRYFFPIIVPIIALLLRGVLFYIPHPRIKDLVLVGLVIGVFWLQVDALSGYVIPRFYA